MSEVLDVTFAAVTSLQLKQHVIDYMDGNEQKVICFANPEFLVESLGNEQLKSYLSSSDLNLADGIGVLWAAKRNGQPLPERLTGTDFVHMICQLSSERQYRLFFLGATSETVITAKANMERLYPNCNIVGIRDGFFDHDENDQIIHQINQSDADIVMVCLGNPKQEAWIERNRGQLNAKLVFGNGGALDFAAGNVKRAPAWMQRVGLEWLFRLAQDFSITRIKRQLKLVKFVRLVLSQRKHH